MALDPDYYIPMESPKVHRTHLGEQSNRKIFRSFRPRTNNVMIIDHCIDALRELIQCGGDLTPIPIVWSDEVGRHVPDTAQLHTCRNFNKLKDLVYARNTSDFENN